MIPYETIIVNHINLCAFKLVTLRYEKFVVLFKINNENDELIRFETLASILSNIDFKCTQLFRDQNYNSEQTCDKLWHASQKAPLKVIITNYAERVGEVHFRRSIKISIQLQYFWTSFKIGSKFLWGRFRAFFLQFFFIGFLACCSLCRAIKIAITGTSLDASEQNLSEVNCDFTKTLTQLWHFDMELFSFL